MPTQGDSGAFSDRGDHTIDLQFKSLSVAPDGSFEGYLSFYGNTDKMNDVMLPGAFTKSLEDKQTYTLLYFHDPKIPIGVFNARNDGNTGLFVQGQLETKSTPMAQSLAELIRMGAVRGLSPGYNVRKKSYSAGVRNLADVELVEGSLTPFPANTKAMITEFKSLYTEEEQKSCSLFGGCSKEKEGDSMEESEESKSEFEASNPHIEESKPYPNEHACRLKNPGEFEDGTMRRVTRKHEGKEYSVIMGRLKGQDTMTEQAYRYSKDSWTADAARSHCSSHEGGSFEAAKGEKSMELETENKIIESWETKTGAVFSKTNYSVIKSAHEALGSLLKLMESETPKEEAKSVGSKEPEETKTETEADEIQKMRAFFKSKLEEEG